MRWGHTPRRVVRGAITLLHEAGATIAGTVLTRVDPDALDSSGDADADVLTCRAMGGIFRNRLIRQLVEHRDEPEPITFDGNRPE